MRVVVSTQPVLLTASLLLTVIAPEQLSVIVPPCAVKPATSVAPAGIVPLQTDKFTAGGQVTVGACVSTVLVNVCVHDAELPHASVTV